MAHILDLAGFEFRFGARMPMRLPGYTGSAWRGGFGRALRRAVCITGFDVCSGCPFATQCIYPYLFETPGGAAAGILADYERVPNPFVLAPAWGDRGTLAAGDTIIVRLVLIGRAIAHAELARQAVIEAGWRGLGPDRGSLGLVSVAPLSLQPPQALPDQIEIRLVSPLRLVEQGRLVEPAALRPRTLLLSLVRRVSLLAQLHGSGPLALDYRALKEVAETVEFEARSLCWAEWHRYSARQRRLLAMGGLLGSISLRLKGLEPFWPFLSLAPWVHAGKGATMGLGAMQIIPSRPAPDIAGRKLAAPADPPAIRQDHGQPNADPR
jgi:hypothetical protein